MTASSRPTSIPGVQTFHRREAWQSSKQPVTGPAIHWPSIDTFPLHYTADDDLIDGDPGESASQLPQYLRNIQNAYVSGRGYSIGYNFAVDWLGGVWELRGSDIKCAANKGWNHRTLAILCLVDGADPVTAEAAASIRALRAESDRRSRRNLNLVPHSAIGSTACCGDGIRSQISAGVFNLTVPIEPPKPPPEEDDMFTDEDRANLNLALKIAKDEQSRSLGRYTWTKANVTWFRRAANAVLTKLGIVQESLDEIEADIERIDDGS